MAERLFIRISSGTERVNWVVLDQDGRAKMPPMYGELEEVASQTTGRQVIVLVPGTHVTLAKAKVPTRNRQKTLQAIPFVLEDQIVDDVDDLHFAIGQRENDDVSVAIVSHKQMQHWATMIEHAGIKPTVMVPEHLSVPASNGHWSVLLDGDKALVRMGEQAGFVTEPENLGQMLPRAVKESENSPDGFQIFNCGIGRAADCQSWGIDSENIVEDQCQQGALTVLAQNYELNNSINLLQGDYSKSERIGKMWRPWRPAAVMGAIFIMLYAGGMIAEYITLANQKETINNQIIQILKKSFPESKNFGKNAVSVMRTKLKALQPGAGDGSHIGFLNFLSQVGPKLVKTNDLNVMRMHYKENRLDLELQVSNIQLLDKLVEELKQNKNFSVELLGSAKKGEKYEARVRIKQT